MSEFDTGYAQAQIEKSKHPVRNFIKQFYVKNILKRIQGPTIDFGCGAGQTLEKLPAGSVGLELNKNLVEYLTQRGLNAKAYDPDTDQYRLLQLQGQTYQSLVIAHVLEHLENPGQVMQQLFSAAAALGVQRIVVIVPGRVGYDSDRTHRTFINAAYIRAQGLDHVAGFRLADQHYFPINVEKMGDYFIYNEMVLTYTKA